MREPKAQVETVICPDCLLPFGRTTGSRQILCRFCAGHISRPWAGLRPVASPGVEQTNMTQN